MKNTILLFALFIIMAWACKPESESKPSQELEKAIRVTDSLTYRAGWVQGYKRAQQIYLVEKSSITAYEFETRMRFELKVDTEVFLEKTH